MLARFLAMLSLLVAVALANIAMEKQILVIKRTQSAQVYKTEILLEQQSRLKLRIEELTGATRTFEQVSQAMQAPSRR